MKTPPTPDVDTITDVTVFSEGRWRAGTDVHLTDGRVSALTPAGELPCGRRVLDGSGGHLTPGLVNTHTHLFQAGLRGIGEGLPLLAWLGAVGEEAARLTPERAYATAAAA
ncbi:amidohydrolase family protein, partial [Streptomyces sp. SID14478]|uniref:amidohydrolase family protein n=1 Tax=Streptomyces sp. SID14478 TaxID=2706073 RepID=UPI0013DD3209|nr:amidohydrolase family protein [Streptomyces sp. SID14478]